MRKSILLPYDKYERLIKQTRQPEQSQQQQQREMVITEEVVQDGGGRLQSEHILDSIPQRYKYKTGAILAHIMRDPENTLNWNDVGELIYKGSAISGSHITDLLKDTQYKHKGHLLKGTVEFHKGLQEIHLPTTLTRVLSTETIQLPKKKSIRPPGIPNTKLKKWIHV